MYKWFLEEFDGSLVEYSTQDQGVAGSSFTGGIALCPCAGHFIPSLVLVQPRKTYLCMTEKKMPDWDVKNQIKQTNGFMQMKKNATSAKNRNIDKQYLLLKFTEMFLCQNCTNSAEVSAKQNGHQSYKKQHLLINYWLK